MIILHPYFILFFPFSFLAFLPGLVFGSSCFAIIPLLFLSYLGSSILRVIGERWWFGTAAQQ